MSAFDAMDVDVLEAVKLPFRAEVPPPRAHLRFEPSPARQPRKERLVPVPIDRFDLRVELFKYRLKKAEERVLEMDIDNQVKRPELRKNEVL
ncbi:unnamed protein product [Bursaphelenchus okinawaensis]|uniref:Uncharacterized protein n=1 Tax=Bursaphelenchus okinawaensis TaxID=465554 RepID=A0A811LTK6_9BILA|nr:unnamed protein product [Bursaphelenchus okinawaensis]CAG9128332.1 unnamed protein product [Bursaphelenchus okinawaensis]